MRSSPDCSDRCKVRHQPRFGGDDVEQRGIGLDAVERGQPQARQVRHVTQDRAHKFAKSQIAKSRVAEGLVIEIASPRGQIDTRKYDVAMSRFDQRTRGGHRIRQRQRARHAAPERDDAEGAAVVAAVLHGEERTRVRRGARGRRRDGRVIARERAPRCRVGFRGVRQDDDTLRQRRE